MSREISDPIEDHRVLPLAGFEVTQCRFDYQLTLHLKGPGGMAELVIEQDFTLSLPGLTEQALCPGGHPRELAPAIELYGLAIERATATLDGELEIVFTDGTILRAGPGEHYEAWSLVAASGAQVIAIPGGGLFDLPAPGRVG